MIINSFHSASFKRHAPSVKKTALVRLPFLIALVVWQIAALSVLYFRGVAFPTPCRTLLRLASLFVGERFLDYSLYRHIGSSLQRWLAGFGITAVLGISYGLLAGVMPLFEKATAKIPQMLLLIPGSAWIPVALLLFGIGEPATMFMIAITAFAPIAINVQSGVKIIDIRLIRAATMMEVGKRILFFRSFCPPPCRPFSVAYGSASGLADAFRLPLKWSSVPVWDT